MQTYTDDDKYVLTSNGAVVGYSCEVLNPDGSHKDMLPPDLIDGSVTHMANNTVQRTCKLSIQRELDWPNVLLKLRQRVTNDLPSGVRHTAEYSLGVFRPTIPQRPVGAAPVTFDVIGADKISLFQRIIGDTRVSPIGSSVLAQVARAINETGIPGQLIIDSTDSDVILDANKVWALDPEAPTRYIDWINNLLAMTTYRALFADENGDFRVERFVDPALRAASWVFDTSDKSRNIVRQDRKSTLEGWTDVNYFTFIRPNLPYEPIIGDGLYIVDLSGGGVKIRAVQEINVASQAQLVSQGNRLVTIAKSLTQTLKISTGPLPVLGHADVVDYLDVEFGPPAHATVNNWTIQLRSGATDILLEVPRG